MDEVWRTALRRQFEAVLDMLGQALRGCPDELWEAGMWRVVAEDPGVGPAAGDDGSIQVFSRFWYIAYHALFFADLYLSGGLEQLDAGFAAPAPFRADEHGAGVLPARVHTRPELLGYLDHVRAKCAATIDGLTDEAAHRPCRWGRGVPFAELLLVNFRHLQLHTEQLSLFLGQQAG